MKELTQFLVKVMILMYMGIMYVVLAFAVIVETLFEGENWKSLFRRFQARIAAHKDAVHAWRADMHEQWQAVRAMFITVRETAKMTRQFKESAKK